MASLSMIASFLGGASVADRPLVRLPQGLAIAKAAKKAQAEETTKPNEVAIDDRANGSRRAAMVAVAAAAVCAIASSQGSALAETSYPKPGTPEARKFYAPICVTMPTAKVCHK